MRKISISPKVILGQLTYDGKLYILPLTWKDNNGILIAGQSGSGKSQTASLYLNQLAYQGVQLIICDYDAPDGEAETLSGRVSHLAPAFYLPPAKDPDDIKQRLEALEYEYRLRLDDPTRRFPLMLVIDEVSAFLSYIKGDKDNAKAIEAFARNLLQFRKVNIRSLIIGQEWSSGFSTQLMRPIRSAFKVKVIHQLDGPNSKMVLDNPATDTIRKIGRLKTGQAYYNDYFLYVPLLDKVAKQRAIARLAEFDYPGREAPATMAVEASVSHSQARLPHDRQIIGQMIDRYASGLAGGFGIEDKEDWIRFLISRGYTKKQIIYDILKGGATMLGPLYERIIAE